MISDRPEILLVDTQNRPHCEDGPFCKWRDETALYAYHGVFVPYWIIENPETITVDDIFEEENQEIRRVMMEKMGMRRFLIEAKPEILDEDSHKINWNRTLFRVKNDVFLYCSDPSTKRNYVIQVAREVKSCEEADAWMYHGRVAIDGKPYKQVSRT
jgi:hypothetical protein